MLKKLEKKRRVLELGFALGFVLTVLLTAFAAHRRQVADRVCADTVRLHILANSDTLEDQLVKLQVRDAISPPCPTAFCRPAPPPGPKPPCGRRCPCCTRPHSRPCTKPTAPRLPG